MSQNIISYIQSDQVNNALPLAQTYLKDNNLAVPRAYTILRSLNDLVYSATKRKLLCKSSPKYIYELADLCCSVISVTWDCNQLSFLQCMYHITRYLIDQDYVLETKTLCEYFFILKERQKIKSWTPSEKLVMSNTIRNFFNFICDAETSFFINPMENDPNSAFSWWKFILRLVELNDLEKLPSSFGVTSSILCKIHDTSNFSIQIKFGSTCLAAYSDWFIKLHSENKKIKLIGSDLSKLGLLLDTFIFYMSDNIIITNGNNLILNFLNNLITLLDNDSEAFTKLQILLTTISLVTTKDIDSSLGHFTDFFEHSNHKIDNEITCFISHYIFKMRTLMAKSLKFSDNTLIKIIKAVLSLLSEIKRSNNSIQRRNSDQVNALYTVLYFTYTLVNSSPNPTSLLKEVYLDLKFVFKSFISIANLSSNLVSFGVSGCLNTILVLRRNDLHQESASLSKMLVKFLLSVSSATLQSSSSFKNHVNYTLNAFATSHGKIGQGMSALVGLVAFAITHKDFASSALTSWAELKNIETSSIDLKITFYDIVKNYKDLLEEWQKLDLDDVSFDEFLLFEIQAYTKFRSLYNEPVLAVYKIAAKVCKNKFNLAEILICAVDAITTQDDLITNIKNFELSLSNVIQLLNQHLESKVNIDKAYIYCLLGSLHYQKVRCSLMHLRKKSEAEVIQVDIKSKDVVPVLQANEGDVLNDCSIAPAFSFLKLDNQSQIMDKMQQSLDYWKLFSECLTIDESNKRFLPLLGYLKTLGYLYRLYSYKLKEIECWELLYSIGKISSSFKHQVLAVAELLSLKFKVDSDWIDEAKKAIQNANCFDNNSYIKQLFIVNLAKNAYFNNKLEESRSLLKSLDINTVEYNFLVYVQHQVLSTLLYLAFVQNGFQSPTAPKAYQVLIIKVFEQMLYVVRKTKWNNFTELCVVQTLLMDTSFLLGRNFSDTKYVRYARCYCKEQLNLAQRLALPIRVSQLLILLASLDKHCMNIVDCDLKLKGIEAILELGTLSVEIEVEKEADSGASPKLLDPVRAKPEFTTHPIDCPCYHCSNFDYQIQALQAITLRASFCVSNKSIPQAKQLFKVGKELINNIHKRHGTTCEEIVTSLIDTEIRFYNEVVKALGEWNMFPKAITYFEVAMKRLQEMPSQDQNLKNYLNIQDIIIKWSQNETFIQKKQGSTRVIPTQSMSSAAECLTPENGKNVLPCVTPPQNVDITISPLVTRIRRRLILDDESDSESDEDEVGSPSIIETSLIDDAKEDKSNMILKDGSKSKRNFLSGVTTRTQCQTDLKVTRKNGLSALDLKGMPASDMKCPRTTRSTIKMDCDNEAPSTRTRTTLKSSNLNIPTKIIPSSVPCLIPQNGSCFTKPQDKKITISPVATRIRRRLILDDGSENDSESENSCVFKSSVNIDMKEDMHNVDLNQGFCVDVDNEESVKFKKNILSSNNEGTASLNSAFTEKVATKSQCQTEKKITRKNGLAKLALKGMPASDMKCPRTTRSTIKVYCDNEAPSTRNLKSNAKQKNKIDPSNESLKSNLPKVSRKLKFGNEDR